MNKALDVFNTSVVTPMLYVVFTAFVLLASGILFKEWGDIGGEDITGVVCAFLIIVAGIFLLHAFKDTNVNLSSVRIHRLDANATTTSNGNTSQSQANLLTQEDNNEDTIFDGITYKRILTESEEFESV